MAETSRSVFANARREALIIVATWLVATIYCCLYYAWFGTSTPERPLGVDDLQPVFGMPRWFFWGVILPWGACVVFTVWFAAFGMADDSLGIDRADTLSQALNQRSESVES